MNLKPYKKEILRRSAQRIKNRQLRKRVLLICIPLILVLTAALIIPWGNADQLAKDAPMENESLKAGSVSCSFVSASLHFGDEVWEITEKQKVDKLYFLLTDADADTDGSSESVQFGDAGDSLEPESSDESPTDMEENLPTMAAGESFLEQSSDQAYGGMLSEGFYTLVFRTADGEEAMFSLTEGQYNAVMEELT